MVPRTWCALAFVALALLEPTAAVSTGIKAKLHTAAKARARSDDVVFEDKPLHEKKVFANGPGKQILAVINTLNDILASIKNEEKEETKNFKAFMDWCDKETKSFSSALSSTQTAKEQGDVSSKELTATVAHLGKELEDLKTLAGELKDSVDQAQAIRDEENDKYTEEMSLNRQSLNQINQAIKMVGKIHSKGGFLQNGVLQRLQINEPGESNYVLGIMKGLLEKLTKTRKELEAEEKKKVAMDDAFMKTKNGQVKATASESSEKKVKLTEIKIQLVKTEAAVKRATKQIEELTVILDQTKRECAEKKTAWKIRSEDRKKEKASIKQATDFLTKTGGKGFVQEAAAPSFLQISSDAPVANVLSQLGSVNAGDFKGAKEVVNKLMTILDKQQKDEDDKKKYCKAELAKKKDEKTEAEDDIKQLATDIEAKQGTVATLADEVKDLEANVVKMRKSLEEAAKIRKKEKASFETNTKDRELAVKVLRQAQRVLGAFYASQDKQFLQLSGGKPKGIPKKPTRSNMPKTWSPTKSSRKSVRSNIVLEMIDKVALEITAEQKEAATDEAKAQTDFEQLGRETQEETDELRQEITERVKTKAKLVVQTNTAKETLGQRKEDQKAIVAQLGCLHKECDQLLKNYDARKKARAFEMSQLKDVLDILHGSSGTGQRTGLLEESNAEMNDREAVLLRDMGAAPAKA